MDAKRAEKNGRIAQTYAETALRREGQVCRVFRFKIQENRLSEKQREQLKMIFVEAKWFINHVLGWAEDEGHLLWEFDPKCKKVTKLDKDGNKETRELKFLPASVKQALTKELCSSVRALSTLKKHGHKIGRLKFRKEVASINLKQYGITHKVLSSKRVKLQGVSGSVVVTGLRQFYDDPDYEFANAKLLNTPLGYYVALTCFINKDKIEKKKTNGKTIGIDFGCSTAFTTSEGEKISVTVRESERLKKLQRKFARQVKGSRRRHKTLGLIKAEYQKMTNKKNDLSNKIVHQFGQYSTIVIQDEQLRNWQKGGHGRAVQHSVLGRVKAKLLLNPNTVVISKTAPTTKLCRNCGAYHDEIGVWDRTFVCACGVSEDRDTHAAKNLVWMYENKLGVGRAKVTRMEMKALVNKALGFEDQLLSTKCEGPGSLGQN